MRGVEGIGRRANPRPKPATTDSNQAILDWDCSMVGRDLVSGMGLLFLPVSIGADWKDGRPETNEPIHRGLHSQVLSLFEFHVSGSIMAGSGLPALVILKGWDRGEGRRHRVDGNARRVDLSPESVCCLPGHLPWATSPVVSVAPWKLRATETSGRCSMWPSRHEPSEGDRENYTSQGRSWLRHCPSNDDQSTFSLLSDGAFQVHM